MFAYTTPLIGGLLIGTASVALLLLLGRIAGISGIVWGAVSAQPDNQLALAVHCGPGAWPLRVPHGHGHALPRSQPLTMVARGYRRFAGGFWCKAGFRLHQWPRCLRPGQALTALARCHHDLYGHRLCNRLCDASPAGGLVNESLCRTALWPGIWGRPGRVRYDRHCQSTGLSGPVRNLGTGSGLCHGRCCLRHPGGLSVCAQA